MTDKLFEKLKSKYHIKEIDVGEFSVLRANGMKFAVKAYYAEGLGHISIMRAKGFFGLMRMDTFMLIPLEKDLPLYSYDRIYAMGNDTLIVELYNTLINQCDMSSLENIKLKFSHITERDPGKHWYDDIKLSESISKKDKKVNTVELDMLAMEHFDAYLDVSATDVKDLGKKKELSASYVNGLLTQGGPSTDIFKKALGEEKTTRLFKKVLFGIE